MKKILLMVFVLCGFAVQVNAMSRLDYDRALNKLIQQRDEAYADLERFARVLSSKGSAEDVSMVIERAQEQHGIEVWWLDPVEYKLIAEECTGKKACDDPTILDQPEKYCQNRLRELADANAIAHNNIEKEIKLLQSPKFKKVYIQNNGQLLAASKALVNVGIQQAYQDKMNRE